MTTGLPALELECLGGDSTVNLASLPRGKPWVVNVWAQWCVGGIQRELDRRGRRVEVLLVAVGRRIQHCSLVLVQPEEGTEVRPRFRNRLTFPQVVDQDKTARVPLRIVAVPQTFFVDAQGRVVHRELEPFTSTAQFDALVSEHLGVEK